MGLTRTIVQYYFSVSIQVVVGETERVRRVA